MLHSLLLPLLFKSPLTPLLQDYLPTTSDFGVQTHMIFILLNLELLILHTFQIETWSEVKITYIKYIIFEWTPTTVRLYNHYQILFFQELNFLYWPYVRMLKKTNKNGYLKNNNNKQIIQIWLLYQSISESFVYEWSKA